MLKKTGWLSPSNTIQLLPNELHLWLVDVEACTHMVATYRSFLSKKELIRAQDYRRDQTRQTFILVRGLLRSLLGYYLDYNPKNFTFNYNKFGKPHLKELSFNLSHTNRYAIYAFALQGKIGVDIEHLRAILDFDNVAASFMSEAEIERLFELPPAIQPQAFFNIWTRKEAIIKAIGQGLSFPLKSIDVDFSPDLPARLLTKDLSQKLWLQAIRVPAGWTATIAFDQPEMKIKKWGISEQDHLAIIEMQLGV